jgi:hypothetical protein
MTTPAVLPAIEFEAPLVNPAPGGLYPVTAWTENTGPSRFLGEGVRVRVHNFGGEASTGVWGASWCASPDDLGPDDIKTGERPEFLDPFEPVTVWSYDQCDLTEPSQVEVRARAAQNLRLREQVMVEREFAARLLADVDTLDTAADIVGAVGHLEALFAETNTVGVIHASATWAASAAQAQLLVRSGTGLRTPLGHLWVFGGGYVDGLTDTLVGTSPTFGWRDEVALRETVKAEWNQFIAIAERSVVVGFEALVGAVDVTG